MKVLIVGYDGLEFDLVEQLDLRNLKQNEYGKVKVPIMREVDMPSTPIVWASFITGQPPEEHGVIIPREWNNRMVHNARVWFSRHIRLFKFANTLKLAEILRRMGFGMKFPNKDSLKCPSFFSTIKPSLAISVPSYNEDVFNTYPFKELEKAMSEEEFRPYYERKVRRLFDEEKRELFEGLKCEWKLLMVHFHITDILGHVYWNDEDKLCSLYEEINELTERIESRLDAETFRLIISDHGIKAGLHTCYGFYSTNINFGMKLTKITDFFKIIMKLTQRD